MAGSRRPYRPPDRRSADRHAAFALDLIEAFEADDRLAAAELLARLAADPLIDPWALCMGVAALAVRRSAGRALGG